MPPVARPQLGHHCGVGELAHPLQQIVGRLVERERLELVDREGGFGEGQGRAVGVVTPREDQHGGHVELATQHSGGERLGRTLERRPAVLEDQQGGARRLAGGGAHRVGERLSELRGLFVAGFGPRIGREVFGQLERAAPQAHRAGVTGAHR